MIGRTWLRSILDRVRWFILAPLQERLDRIESRLPAQSSAQPFEGVTAPATPEAQRVLWLEYRRMELQAASRLSFRDVGFRRYSQTDEDGILLYIFGLINSPHRTCVEICCGNGIECNTANLIVNHGWHGLLVDGDAAAIEVGRNFYAASADTHFYPPQMSSAWVTAENVNELISGHGIEGEVDLLSIDVDGNDYWIWKAITVIQPRVVVVEYQDILGPERSWTIPYRPDFKASDYEVNRGSPPNYGGASLSAYARLGASKGYRLVGCNRYGYNAFFVRTDLGGEVLPEVSVASCFGHPINLRGMGQRFPRVARCEWQEV